jgi:ankyrin repeat protein
MVAAQTGSPELVSEILKYRLDVNGRNYKDESVIEAAVMGYSGSPTRINVLDEGRAEVVRLLAKAGADVNVRDEEGNTPLHKIGDWCVVQALIESGADVNARNNHGQTPLIKARSRKVAHLLVQAGADISARDHDGNTALKTVLENKEDNVGTYLYFPKSPVAELEK